MGGGRGKEAPWRGGGVAAAGVAQGARLVAAAGDSPLNDDTLIRGLPVDSVPLRLHRGPVVADAEAQTARTERVYQEAASAGFAEGLRQGRQEGTSAGYEEGLRAGREEAGRHAGEEAARAVGTATAALVEE